MKNNKKKIAFLMIFVLVGITLLFFGVKTTYNKMEKTKNYVLIEAEFIGSRIYSSDEDGTTYTLTYSYEVDGEEYRISTDYGTGSVPNVGTKKNIKYNPDNPNEAIISGMGSNGLLLLLGFMFTTIPLIPLLSMIVSYTNWISPKIKDKIFGVFIGTVFIILGSACYYMMVSSGNSLSIIYALKTNGLWVIIPIVFIIVGIYVVAASFFSKNNKIITIQNHDEVISNQNHDEVISNQNHVVSAENQVLEEKINNVVDKVEKVSSIVAPILQIIGSLIFTFVCSWIFIIGPDIITKIVITPFLICGLALLLKSVIFLIKGILNFSSSNNDNIQEINEQIDMNLNKFQVITANLFIKLFFAFWFGFLIIMDYQAIKDINDNGLQSLLASLIFWAVGIFFAYDQFKK